MKKCPMLMARGLAGDCLEGECTWWDELEGRCLWVSIERELKVIGNWILLEKLLKKPLAPVR